MTPSGGGGAGDADAESVTSHPGRLILNVIGFLVGLALFVWIVRIAVRGGDWSKLTEASPWLIAMLLGSTVVSAFVNGATFWITIRPLKRIRFLDLQLLNLVANALNYAPLRLGAIARVGYHLRVDRLSIIQLTAWFATVAYLVTLSLGACAIASLARGSIDLVWLAMVVGVIILGGGAARLFVGYGFVHRRLQGVDRIVLDPTSLWGASALRLIDLGAYTVRFAAALAILDITLASVSDIVLLAIVALTAGMIPFGRLGFREACVALVASRLELGAGDIEETWARLALVESMGEMLIFIPFGGLGLLWFRRRWREAGRDSDRTGAPGDEGEGEGILRG